MGELWRDTWLLARPGDTPPPITNTGSPSLLTSPFDEDGVKSQLWSIKLFAYKTTSAQGVHCAKNVWKLYWNLVLHFSITSVCTSTLWIKTVKPITFKTIKIQLDEVRCCFRLRLNIFISKFLFLKSDILGNWWGKVEVMWEKTVQWQIRKIATKNI